MACTQILNGIPVDCEPSMGGIKVVYIANYADVTGFKIADGQIVEITMATEKKFKTYNFLFWKQIESAVFLHLTELL